MVNSIPYADGKYKKRPAPSPMLPIVTLMPRHCGALLAVGLRFLATKERFARSPLVVKRHHDDRVVVGDRCTAAFSANSRGAPETAAPIIDPPCQLSYHQRLAIKPWAVLFEPLLPPRTRHLNYHLRECRERQISLLRPAKYLSRNLRADFIKVRMSIAHRICHEESST